MFYLPYEIIDIIADYHDFDKHQHQKKLKNINEDIISMDSIMKPIAPRLAKECWG